MVAWFMVKDEMVAVVVVRCVSKFMVRDMVDSDLCDSGNGLQIENCLWSYLWRIMLQARLRLLSTTVRTLSSTVRPCGMRERPLN